MSAPTVASDYLDADAAAAAVSALADQVRERTGDYLAALDALERVALDGVAALHAAEVEASA